MVVAAILVLGIAGLIFSVVRLTSPHEPTYEGKTLSEWIAPFCRQTVKGLDAPGGPEHFEELQPVRHAVVQIGTNAVPFLIARLNHRESGLHRTVRQLLEKQPYVSLRLADPNVSKIRAIRALANLGPVAERAIPSLKAQLTDVTLAEHAIYALSGMDAAGMRALAERYRSVPAPIRTQIALVIVNPTGVYRGQEAVMSFGGIHAASQFQANQIPAEELVEVFSQVAKDRTSPFQTPAIQRLGECGSRASNAVPVLMQILNDRNSMTLWSTIRALGQIKSQPEVVVPALTNLLSDSDVRIQMAAASALRAFGYDAPVYSQVPRVIHPPPPVQTKERYF